MKKPVSSARRCRPRWFAVSLVLVALGAVSPRARAQTAETLAFSIRAFDALLSNTPPTQEVVYIADMGFRPSFLRQWTDHLRQIASGRAPKAVFNLGVSAWPNGVVPYTYDSSVTPALSNRFEASLREWQVAANLNFIPWTTQANYLVISNSLPGGVQDSYVGMLGGKQVLHINNAALNNLDCAHEIGHALGMENEQCRSDRDTYVKIHWENFKAGYRTNTSHLLEPNFGILPIRVSDNVTTYDYDSIMEYPTNEAGSGRSPGDPACSDPACTEIEPLEPYYSAQGSPWLGQNPMTSHLSALDKYGMGVRYGLPRTISGHVYDASGAAFPGVTVNLSGGSTYRGPASVVTGTDGSYSFVGIPNNTGAFTVTASLSGHRFSEGSWNVPVQTTDFTMADFHEDAPPTITFSPLTNQATIFDFGNLGGKVSKPSTVTFRITEYNASSANRYWDGGNWILDGSSPTVLLVARISNLAWSPDAVLPSRSQTRYGFYVIDAYAADPLGSQGSANLVVNRSATDTNTPTITLATVSSGQVLASSSLPSLVGTASDPGSGIATVDIFLMRATNPGFVYWTGTTWSSDPTALPANYDANSQVWDVNTTLPSGADLPNAHYQIQVSARNREIPQGSSALSVAFEVNAPGAATPLIVPGTANPWLAGITTNGFHEAGGDVTPDESPVLYTNFTAGVWLQFTASGSAGDAPGAESGPAGVAGFPVSHAAEDGIGAIANSPANALIGVFLDNAQPDPSAPPPDPLDFGSSGSQSYVVLQPELRQPFYIGSGTNASGLRQTVIAPANATRLYLGIQDGSGWYNNPGSFTVAVKPLLPLPSVNSVSASPAAAPILPGTPWTFTAIYSASAPGLRLRVQSTLTTNVEASWTDLPGVPYLTPAGANWTLVTTNVPPATRFFRVLASAPGFADGRSGVLGPFTVLAANGSTTDWDAGGDLESNELLGPPLATMNPNPVVTNWSYGYRLESDLATTNFTFLEGHTTNGAGSANLSGWTRPATDGPHEFVNISANPVVLSFCCGPLLPINPGEMGLWPGSDSTAAVARWTAPTTANYAVSAYWRKIDINADMGCVSSVVVNGTILYTQTWFNGDTPGYTNTVSVTAGDVVDFLLGPAGNYSFDGTRFNATIHLASFANLPAITSVSASAAAAPIQPNAPWTFTAIYSTLVSDLKLRVQSTLTTNSESSWTDLPGNPYMTHVDANWTLKTTSVPEGDRYFRVIASAPGYSDGLSAVVGPFSIVVPLPVVTMPYSASSSYSLEDVPELQNPALVYVHALSGVTANFSSLSNAFSGLANVLMAADPGGSAGFLVKAGQTINLPSLGLGQNAALTLQGVFHGDLASGVVDSNALGIGTGGLPITPAGLSFAAAGTVTHDAMSLQLLAQDLGRFVSQKIGSFLGGSSLDVSRRVTPKGPGPTQPVFTGLMTVDGNYDQFSGTVVIGIAGTNTASQGAQQYDQLVVNGTANLHGGSVAVGLFNPDDQTNRAVVFQPPVGAIFDVLVASNIVVASAVTVRGPIWGDGVFFNWGIVTRPDGLQALRLMAAPYPPNLTLQRTGSGLRLSYPTNYVGYTLQGAATLSPPNWTALSTGTNVVTLTLTNAQQFFRLSKP